MKKFFLFLGLGLMAFVASSYSQAISQDEAWKKVREKVIKDDLAKVEVFVSNRILEANSQMESFGKEEKTPNYTSWFFFVDDAPKANWEHPCRYVFVNSISGEISIHNQSFPPQLEKMKQIVKIKVESAHSRKYNIQKTMSQNSTTSTSGGSNNYAVIISGGISMSSNYERYWNDCSAIYSTLINVYNYRKDQVYVLISDGKSPGNDMSCLDGTYASSPQDLDGDNEDDIDLSATKENVISVFNELSNILTENDTLFVYTTDHGGIYGEQQSYLCLWNNGKLYDYELAQLMSNISCKAMICMEQCFSGGFIDNIAAQNREICTACNHNESSYATDDLVYDEFVYHWTAAVTGQTPYGTVVNADTNGDGQISMYEAFAYAQNHDTQNEHPQYSSTPYNLGNNLYLSNQSFQGVHVISDSETYTIHGLPKCFNVQWTLSNNYYDTNCIQKNYPAFNQCVITRQNGTNMYDALLTANIKYGGNVVKTLTKHVYAHYGLIGQYRFNNTNHTINYPYPLYVKPGYIVTITSPNLIGSTVSYDGVYNTTPSFWEFNGNLGQLKVGIPSGCTIPVIVSVIGENGNQYTLPLIPSNTANSLSVSQNGGSLNIVLYSKDNTVIENNVDYSISEIMDSKPVWNLEIFNCTTSEKVIAKRVVEKSTSVSVHDWPKGLYIVQAKAGESLISKKIYIK